MARGKNGIRFNRVSPNVMSKISGHGIIIELNVNGKLLNKENHF